MSFLNLKGFLFDIVHDYGFKNQELEVKSAAR